MTTKIEATYQDGVLKPLRPLPLAEGTTVDVLVLADNGQTPDKTGRATPDPSTSAQLIAEIAALSVRHGIVETASRDHDQVLYGRSQPE